MAAEDSTIHASAVLVGPRALLIVGPSGSGKSHLALKLLQAGDAGLLPFARLVADDRARIEPCHGRLIVRPADKLKGLIEVRSLGIRRMAFEPAAIVGHRSRRNRRATLAVAARSGNGHCRRQAGATCGRTRD
jgi:serine kinase of HPr protein (carbohydrate metabolism regulator)